MNEFVISPNDEINSEYINYINKCKKELNNLSYSLKVNCLNKSLIKMLDNLLKDSSNKSIILLDIDNITLTAHINFNCIENVWKSFEMIRNIDPINTEMLCRTAWNTVNINNNFSKLVFKEELNSFIIFKLKTLIIYLITINEDPKLNVLYYGQGVDDKLSRNSPYFWLLAYKNLITRKFGKINNILKESTIKYLETKYNVDIVFVTSRSCQYNGYHALKCDFALAGLRAPLYLTSFSFLSNPDYVISNRIVIMKDEFKDFNTKGLIAKMLDERYNYEHVILIDDTKKNIEEFLKCNSDPKFFGILYDEKLDYAFEKYIINFDDLIDVVYDEYML